MLREYLLKEIREKLRIMVDLCIMQILIMPLLTAIIMRVAIKTLRVLVQACSLMVTIAIMTIMIIITTIIAINKAIIAIAVTTATTAS